MRADSDGIINEIQALPAAILCRDLGAGRKSQEDRIDPMAGIFLARQPGDQVRKGDVLAWAYGNRAQDMGDDLIAAGPKIFLIKDQATQAAEIVRDTF